MKPKQILLFGSLITLVLVLLWYFEVIGEPIAALGGAFLTFLSYLLSNKANTDNEVDKKSVEINQTHTGQGDNVGGNKIVRK